MKKPRMPMGSFKNLVNRRRPVINSVVRETTSGGIVYRKNDKGGVEILLIKDAKDRWTIPKGHVEPGEETGATAEREIREETGLKDMEVLVWLGKVNFRYRRGQALILMTMHIWLVEGKGESNRLHPEEWMNDAKWIPANEALDLIAYEDIGKIMLVGMKKIREGKF
jgi:ADP-ribose pyrophosphatase YjhB (NUDIX family)